MVCLYIPCQGYHQLVYHTIFLLQGCIFHEIQEKRLTYAFLTSYNDTAHIICKDCDGDSMPGVFREDTDSVCTQDADWRNFMNAAESRGQVEARCK